MKSEKPILRFAPSPTGILHIGGARTALFNWLYARARGGKFLLRIEDTDHERSTSEARQAIIDGLQWLGLDWDGEPVSQMSRIERHRQAVESLLADGQAYRCYSSKEEVETARALARAKGQAFRFDSIWRDRGKDDWPSSEPYVIRLKAPRTGQLVIDDIVQGTVKWNADHMDDLVLMRSDGTPTYNLAVVVDDHDMGITHVVRGDDHLTNAARQCMIYRALAWEMPVFAHIPLIHGPDGAKLSKRHGAIGVMRYRELGFLPAALRNYLARLGWSHGDDEFFTDEQALSWFDLKDVGRAPARFDWDKLKNLNFQHMRVCKPEDLLAAIIDFAASTYGQKLTNEQKHKALLSMPHLINRAKTLSELFDLLHFILCKGLPELDQKAKEILSTQARKDLVRLTESLQSVNNWRSEYLEKELRRFVENAGVKLGQVAQPIRAALTGRTVSAGIFEVLEILGRDESLARLRAASATADTKEICAEERSAGE